MVQLVGALSHTPEVAGSIPSQGIYVVCGFGAHTGGDLSMFLSHIDVSLCPKSIMKKTWETLVWSHE